MRGMLPPPPAAPRGGGAARHESEKPRRGAGRMARGGCVRAGALHAPDIVPVTAADAARFAASARRRRCMATSGSPCAPRATRTAARCGASSFRPAHPGGSLSPSATRPASRCAADRRRRRVARQCVAHHRPRDGRARRRAARRPPPIRAAIPAPDAPGPTEPRHPDGGVGSPLNRASWGGAGAPGAPGGAAPDRSRPDPPPRAGMGARRPAPDHCAAASGAAAPSAH